MNPARLVPRRQENNARLRFLSRGEYAKLAAVIERDHPEHFPTFVVSIYSGMRLGEQLSVTWNQVDFKRQVIRLTKTKNGSARNVPLKSTALATTKSPWDTAPHGATNPVFPRPGESADYRPWFLPALKESGITGCTWHSNRHTFCSWLAIAGRSIKDIQILVGHKTIAMAARYAHLSPESTALASESIV